MVVLSCIEMEEPALDTFRSKSESRVIVTKNPDGIRAGPFRMCGRGGKIQNPDLKAKDTRSEAASSSSSSNFGRGRTLCRSKKASANRSSPPSSQSSAPKLPSSSRATTASLSIHLPRSDPQKKSGSMASNDHPEPNSSSTSCSRKSESYSSSRGSVVSSAPAPNTSRGASHASSSSASHSRSAVFHASSPNGQSPRGTSSSRLNSNEASVNKKDLSKRSSRSLDRDSKDKSPHPVVASPRPDDVRLDKDMTQMINKVRMITDYHKAEDFCKGTVDGDTFNLCLAQGHACKLMREAGGQERYLGMALKLAVQGDWIVSNLKWSQDMREKLHGRSCLILLGQNKAEGLMDKFLHHNGHLLKVSTRLYFPKMEYATKKSIDFRLSIIDIDDTEVESIVKTRSD